MMDNYTYRWTIDDVLDPNSAFWKKMYADIKDKPETGLEAIERDMWKERIGEFLAYFKKYSNKEPADVKSIKDTEFLIVDVLWGLVSEEDKEILFHNDVEYFNYWIDTCPPPLLDEYIKRISKGESLINSKSTNKNVNKIIKSTIENSSSPQSCNVTISDGKLILCSTNHEALKKFKTVMVKLGNKVQAYTIKKNDKNEEVHSYIFEMKKR